MKFDNDGECFNLIDTSSSKNCLEPVSDEKKAKMYQAKVISFYLIFG